MDSNTGNRTSSASVLKVLADETRLAVVKQLLSGPKYVADINRKLDVEQNLLSHHLKMLRDAGLLVTNQEGKHRRYSVALSIQGSRPGRTINPAAV